VDSNWKMSDATDTSNTQGLVKHIIRVITLVMHMELNMREQDSTHK